MKIIAALFTIIVLYFGAVHFSGGAFYGFGLPLGGERAQLRQLATSFMEDIQFKDFDKAASYHAPDVVDSVDIPFLLQRLFLQKPESLDIMSYDIVFCKLDRSGFRGRTKVRMKAKNLMNKEIRSQYFLLFFHRTDLNSPWYMELENSLRKVTGDKDKQH